MKTGIYKITNLVNGKVYIGQSINLTHRMNEHRLKLLKNLHPNDHLQNAWNKYGEENFKFEILEHCCKEKLTEREDYWVNYYGGIHCKDTYNLREPEVVKGYCKETREKMSKAQKRRNLSGENNPMYGKHHTEEARRAMSESLKGRICPIKGRKMKYNFTEEGRKKKSEAAKNRIWTEESKQKCRENILRLLQDPAYRERIKQAAQKRIKYTEEKKQEIYEVFKELKSRKATSKKLGIPLESCRLIINEMLEKDKSK